MKIRSVDVLPQVDEEGKIVDAKFKTFGCGSAIASSSLATEWIKGKDVDSAGKIKNSDIAKELSLPPVKLHCSSEGLCEPFKGSFFSHYLFFGSAGRRCHPRSAQGLQDQEGEGQSLTSSVKSGKQERERNLVREAAIHQSMQSNRQTSNIIIPTEKLLAKIWTCPG